MSDTDAVDPSELSEEELEERRQQLKDSVEEEVAALEEAEASALDALADATDDAEETYEVELTGGITVEVKDAIPGDLEKQAANINEDDVTAGVESMIDVMCEVIQTDGYDSEAVWREYLSRYGSTNLMECAMAVTEPYWERQEELQDQRQFRRER